MTGSSMSRMMPRNIESGKTGDKRDRRPLQTAMKKSRKAGRRGWGGRSSRKREERAWDSFWKGGDRAG